MISGRGEPSGSSAAPSRRRSLGPRTMPPPARGARRSGSSNDTAATSGPTRSTRRPTASGGTISGREVTPPAPIASTPSTGPRTPIPPIATYSPCPGRAPTGYGRTAAATEPRPGWRLDGLRDQRRVHRSRRRERVAGGQRAARPAALGSDRRAAPPLAGIRISRVVRGQSQLEQRLLPGSLDGRRRGLVPLGRARPARRCPPLERLSRSGPRRR